MSNLHQERTLLLIDHYQSTAVATLQWAKVVHDAAFRVDLSVDQQAGLLNGMLEAASASNQALAALRSLLAVEPDLPGGPTMAAPIMILN